jgi:hypothetical protein
MMFIDPYCITLIITERIRRLMEAGHLAEIEPDREYGYTCLAVFGVSIDDIAAIRDEDAGARQLLWFHLNDGRIVSGSPNALGCGCCSPKVTLQ